jgi:TonB family protein
MQYKSVVVILLLAIVVAAARAQTSPGDFSVSARRFVAPTYPVAAWLARIQGTVVIEVAIKPDGTVGSVKFVSAYPMLRESVESALKQWLFLPIPAAATLRITTRFHLNSDCPATGSQEPDKRYYAQTLVTSDLPSNIDVTTCLPITTINQN